MVDWSVALTIFLAIVAASLVGKWIERREAGSLSAIEREHAIKTPQTVEEYVKQHYPGAYNA